MLLQIGSLVVHLTLLLGLLRSHHLLVAGGVWSVARILIHIFNFKVGGVVLLGGGGLALTLARAAGAFIGTAGSDLHGVALRLAHMGVGEDATSRMVAIGWRHLLQTVTVLRLGCYRHVFVEVVLAATFPRLLLV